MKLYRILGIDDRILRKTEESVKTRQLKIFNILALMVLLITVLSSAGGMFYAAIIFHNWIIAILLGIFSGFIVLNIYKILLVTSLSPRKSPLHPYHINHSKIYGSIDLKEVELMSDEKILNEVTSNKQKLRDLPMVKIVNKRNFISTFINMLIRVSVLSLFAVIIGNGIELFIFHDEINAIINEILKRGPNDSNNWVINELLTPKNGADFILINTNSILLAVDLLIDGLGGFKYFYDILIVIFFLIPLLILYRSKEINNGAYLKELTIDEISISHYHYLISNRYCQKLSNGISELDFNNTKKNKLIEQFK